MAEGRVQSVEERALWAASIWDAILLIIRLSGRLPREMGSIPMPPITATVDQWQSQQT